MPTTIYHSTSWWLFFSCEGGLVKLLRWLIWCYYNVVVSGIWLPFTHLASKYFLSVWMFFKEFSARHSPLFCLFHIVAGFVPPLKSHHHHAWVYSCTVVEIMKWRFIFVFLYLRYVIAILFFVENLSLSFFTDNKYLISSWKWAIKIISLYF